MSKGVKIFSAVVVLAAFAGGWLWFGQSTLSSSIKTESTTAADANQAAELDAADDQIEAELDAEQSAANKKVAATTSTRAADAKKAPQKQARAFLPPAGTALKDMFDALADQARNGDDQAACRLGLELSRCQQWATATQDPLVVDQRLQLLARSPTFAEKLPEIRNAQANAMQTNKQVCDGFSGDTAAAMDWLRMGAERGHLPSMKRLFQHPPQTQGADATTLARLQYYRSNIESYANQLIASGDRETQRTLMQVYEGAQWAPHQLRDAIAINPVRMHALRLVTEASNTYRTANDAPNGSDLLDPAASLTVAQRAEAQAYAQQVLFEQSKHPAAPIPSAPSPARVTRLTIPGMMDPFAYDPEDCEK